VMLHKVTMLDSGLYESIQERRGSHRMGCHTSVGAAAGCGSAGDCRTSGVSVTGRSRLPPTVPFVPAPDQSE